jgi:hypothetical protein
VDCPNYNQSVKKTHLQSPAVLKLATHHKQLLSTKSKLKKIGSFLSKSDKPNPPLQE